MEFAIEKWIYGGEGLARMPIDENGRGKAVFIPFALPGEKVEAELTEERPGFARAKLTGIDVPSSSRVEPPCPYFFQCGGCQHQVAEYSRQLEWKRDVLVETLQRTAKIKLERDVQLVASEPYQYRNRTRLKVQSSPEFAIGYHRFGTNELLAVEECPISSPLIQGAITAMWAVGRAGVEAYDLREVQFFANHSDNELLVEFYSDGDSDVPRLKPFAEALRAQLGEILGVTIFPRGIPADDEDRPAESAANQNIRKITIGQASLTYSTRHGEFRVSAGSFFQTNRFLIDDLVNTAIGDSDGRTALDLYAGTGLFSAPLAKRFDRVLAVEIAPASFGDLQHNVTPSVKAIQSTTEQYLRNAGKRSGLDLVVLDPPRSGMGERTARLLGQMQVPRITYVSCDPATLARDVRVLATTGYRIESVHLVDMFPQTFHMETVVQLAR